MNHYQEIIEIAKNITERLIAIRRDFHRHPELGLNERRTAKVVQEQLEKLDLKVTSSIGKTGLCGLLEGKSRGKCIAIRSDMDALPITERRESPYKSINEGKMHACGHDAHMSCVLGAAMILSHFQERISGSVKFIFQPAEEILTGGAIEMIAEGVLENPHVDAIISLHTDPQTKTGKIAIKKGPLMASADLFTIEIAGEGGHGAGPHLANDTIVTSSEVILALQTIASRRIDPLSPVVVSVGSIHGGTSFNILPPKVTLKGTVRTLSVEVQEQIPGIIEKIVEKVCEAHGCTSEVRYNKGVPVLFNDGEMVELFRKTTQQMYGDESVRELQNPVMGGEDFACYLEKVPGAMLWLGVRNEQKGVIHPWHSPYFDIDEEALPFGTAILSAIVLNYLTTT
jgi:amidohydrolase